MELGVASVMTSRSFSRVADGRGMDKPSCAVHRGVRDLVRGSHVACERRAPMGRSWGGDMRDEMEIEGKR